MKTTSHDLPPEQLSHLIGAIYDCAIDPNRWAPTLGEICRLLDLSAACLGVDDAATHEHLYNCNVGIESDWLERRTQYGPDISAFMALVPGLMTRPLNEPVVTSRDIDRRDPRYLENRYVREWTRPQGIVDALHVTLIRDADRIGSLFCGRHESVGPIGEREVRVMRLLAPHLRRAVTIGDLLDMRMLEAHALKSTLDGVSAGVLLVGEGGEVLHANRSATRMLNKKSPIATAQGCLGAPDCATSAALRNAIAAARDDVEMGEQGLSLALANACAAPALAYVLPLANGHARTRLAPRALAAVFVREAMSGPLRNIGAVAAAFALSPAEARLLEQVCAPGVTLIDAAAALDIAETTAKTQIKNIFAKTGVNRQTDLVALVHRLNV